MSGDNPETGGEGLTEGDRERIADFLDVDREDRDPSILVPDSGEEISPTSNRHSPRESTTGITEARCKTIRRDMSEAITVREVMEDYDTHISEVMKHAYGECTHSHEVPATASPQISPSECSQFRERYAAGYPVSEIASEFYRADNTVTRHIFGRCSHPPGYRAVLTSEVAEWECSRLRETYVGNAKVGVPAAATAMRLPIDVAATHLFGYCECEGEVQPAESVDEGSP